MGGAPPLVWDPHSGSPDAPTFSCSARSSLPQSQAWGRAGCKSWNADAEKEDEVLGSRLPHLSGREAGIPLPRRKRRKLSPDPRRPRYHSAKQHGGSLRPAHSRLAVLPAILGLDWRECDAGHKAWVPTQWQTSCGGLGQLLPSVSQFPHL